MTYTSKNKSMSETDFLDMVTVMYERCGKPIGKQGKRWYHDFGTHPRDILVNACKRIGYEGSRNPITWRTIKDAITEVTPKVEVAGKVGCCYCDTLGMIDYWKEINNVMYQYSARCHKCRTSRYINEPFYNEVFPNDDIQPHSTPEQMVCGKHILEDVVKVVTGREHEDAAQERKRDRQLYREKTL